MLKTKVEMNNALENIVDFYDNNKIIKEIGKNEKAAVFVVDMINDFNFTSDMQNPLAIKIIPKLSKMLTNANLSGKKIYHVNEAHTEESIEFLTFARHGEIGTQGAKIVAELEKVPYEEIFYKNSTNGIHNDKIKKWINENPEIDTIIICGVLADMCVLQFASGVKTYCNQINRKMNVVIPKELVETSDFEGHNRDLFYYMALEFMAQGGIEIVNNIKFEV